jgi:hypothetical protein
MRSLSGSDQFAVAAAITLSKSALLSTQVFVGFIDPVGAWRVENVEVDSIFQGFCFVRHMGRDGQDVTGAYHDDLSIDPEFQGAFDNVCDLLVMMTVLGNDAALFQQYACQHHVFTDDEMPLEERVEIF